MSQFIALHMQHNGFVVLQRYYERHFTPVGKAMLLLLMISLSLGMVGTEVLIYVFLCGQAALWAGTILVGWYSRPKAVSARMIFPERLQAGQKVLCQVELHNRGKRPLFHLLSEMLLLGPDQKTILLTQSREAFSLARAEVACFEVEWTPALRGRWQLREIQVISRFPLGLSLWRNHVRVDAPVWVYPEPLFWPEQPWQQRVAAQLHTQSQTSVMRGDSLEFQGIRPWLTGDSPRFIHWPSLARTGQLAVREYQESPGHQIALVLSGLGSEQADSALVAQFERAVSLTAGLLLTLASQRMHQLMLAQIGTHLEFSEHSPLSVEHLMLRLAQVEALEPQTFDLLWEALLQTPPTLLLLVVAVWTPAHEQLRLQCLSRRWPLEIITASEELSLGSEVR